MNGRQRRQWRDMLRRSFSPLDWFANGGSPPHTNGDVSMWVYRQILEVGRTRFSVGFFAPDGNWNQDTVLDDREGAAARCHWLNGGEESNPDEAFGIGPDVVGREASIRLGP